MGLWFGNPVSCGCLLFFLQNMQFVLFLLRNLAIFPFFFFPLNIDQEFVILFFFFPLSLMPLCPSIIWVDEGHKLPWDFLKKTQICCVKKGFSRNFFHLYMMLIPFKISLPLSCSSSPNTMIRSKSMTSDQAPKKKKTQLLLLMSFINEFLIFLRKQILVWIPSVWLQERLGSLRAFGISIFSSSSFFSSGCTYDLLFLIFLLRQGTVPWWGLDRTQTK